MLCDKCGKRTATTHIHANIGGVTREMNLCSYCASVMGYGAVFGGLNGLVGSLLEEQHAAQNQDAKRCPQCGAAFSEIAESGKLGCAACYETFAEELAPSLQRMHGRTKHVGRTPYTRRPADERAERLNRLKSQLAEAVAAEAFEKAASLRDEIKALEQAGGKGLDGESTAPADSGRGTLPEGGEEHV